MPVVPTKKRKSAAEEVDAGTTKKRATKKQQKSPGAQLVDTVLSIGYSPPQNTADFKKQIIELAEYTRSLEEIISNGGKPVLDNAGRASAARDLRYKIARDVEKVMKVCLKFLE